MTTRQTPLSVSQRTNPYSKALRSSCRYCRKRKIKCDGNIPCGLCTSRKIDCVHDEKARMGRPRKEEEEQDGSVMEERMNLDLPNNKSISMNLGSILDSAFNDTFIGDLPTTAFSAAVHGYLREHGQLLESQIDPFHKAQQKPCTPDVYDIFYPLIIKDVLDGCRWHFSALSLAQMKEGQAHGKAPQGKRPAYFPIGMRIDMTTSMTSTDYEPGPSSNYPEPNQVELKRLYKVWSDVHPLSSCVSFSSMETNDYSSRAIRHLVIAEAQQLEGETYSISESHFSYACQLYRQIQIPVFDDDQENVDKTIQHLLSACQAALLFGWHDFANVRAKRGATYMAASGQLFGRLQVLVNTNLSNNTELQTNSNIKVIRSLSSIFSLMTLWAFSQLDRSTGNLGIGWTVSESMILKRDEIRIVQIIVTDAVVRLCSVLLNNHPKVISSTHARSQDKDEEEDLQRQLIVAQILYPHVCSIKLMEEKEVAEDRLRKSKNTIDLVEGVRDCVRLILLLPGKNAFLPLPSVGQELLKVCQSALDNLIKLAGLTQYRHDDVLFSNVAFSHSAKSTKDIVNDGQEPLRKTVAAYLFDLLAETTERVCESFEKSFIEGSFTLTNLNEWKSIYETISDAKLDLMDTSNLIISREIVKKNLERLQSIPSMMEDTPSAPSIMDGSSLFTTGNTASSMVTPDPTISSIVTPDASTIDAGLIIDHLSFDITEPYKSGFIQQVNSDPQIDEKQEESLFNLLWGYYPTSIE